MPVVKATGLRCSKSLRRERSTLLCVEPLQVATYREVPLGKQHLLFGLERIVVEIRFLRFDIGVKFQQFFGAEQGKSCGREYGR